MQVYPYDEYAYALLYFTGSDHCNRSMRYHAGKLQPPLTLSDHGLRSKGRGGVAEGACVLPSPPDEAAIFSFLGLEYIPPEERG